MSFLPRSVGSVPFLLHGAGRSVAPVVQDRAWRTVSISLRGRRFLQDRRLMLSRSAHTLRRVLIEELPPQIKSGEDVPVSLRLHQ
jgi:hypothetical protein